MILGLYALLGAAMFYLGSRALITEPIWSLYPPRIARFMDCAACTGFWWGVIWHLSIGRRLDVDIGPLPAQDPATPILVGLCMMMLVPIVAALGLYGLTALSAVAPEPPSDDEA